MQELLQRPKVIRWAPEIPQPQLSSNDQSISALVVFKDGLPRVLAFRIRVGVSYTQFLSSSQPSTPALNFSPYTILPWQESGRKSHHLAQGHVCMYVSLSTLQGGWWWWCTHRYSDDLGKSFEREPESICIWGAEANCGAFVSEPGKGILVSEMRANANHWQPSN